MSADAPQQVFGIIDPDYARIFTLARVIAWTYGYACLAHGSFTRDLDLLLVPWTEGASDDVERIVNMICEAAKLNRRSDSTEKPHGRKAWTLLFPEFGDCRWVDISAIPVCGSRKERRPMNDGISRIAAERQRQISVEGWTAQHDDEYSGDHLALAAAWYATPSEIRDQLDVNDMSLWPADWDLMWFKPGARIRELEKAGALIAAEIDRLLRKELGA